MVRSAGFVFSVCAMAAFSAAAAAPADGGEWTIASGEVETLDASATISHLALDGSLTLVTLRRPSPILRSTARSRSARARRSP